MYSDHLKPFPFAPICLWMCNILMTTGGVSLTDMSSYVNVRKEILNRDPVVHRMSPELMVQSGMFNMSYAMVLIDVLDIDQVKQLMTVCVHLRVQWRLDYLSWDPASFNNTSEIMLETRSLWLPNIVVIVGYGESLSLDFPEWATVSSEGTVQVLVQTYISFRCAVDLKKYPFDTQECKIGLIIIPQTDDGYEINYLINSYTFDAHPYAIDGEWRLLSFSARLHVDANGQRYPLYLVKVRRSSTYYVIAIILPIVLTSSMFSLVFLIPARSGEKIALFVSLYTSLTLYFNFVSAVMPRNLSSAPYLIILLLGALFQGLLTNIATLFVVNKYEQEKILVSRKKVTAVKQIDNTSLEDTGNSMDERGRESNIGSESKDLNQVITSSVRCCLTSAQWDKLLFFLFSTTQVVLLGALFGATDWLSEAQTLRF